MKNTIKEKSCGGNKRLTSPWRVKKKKKKGYCDYYIIINFTCDYV